MNYDLTDEQKLWQKTVHEFVAKEVQPKAHEVDMTSEYNWTATRNIRSIAEHRALARASSILDVERRRSRPRWAGAVPRTRVSPARGYT